ncbi:MAG TPA: large-conductance mechanosensitive channel protein MscL [Firmicutes bacterium]|nr:large-conductance mechanosensitive channel protein MscL [Candidatus Fermentithermobacillaceae bacterium]
MLQEFKKFAMRGNVIDLAIGVIIGGAFGKIVSSLVNDILMPLLGIVVGRIDLTTLKLVIRPASEDVAELAIYYGQFLQTAVDFLIIAFSLFCITRAIVRLQKKEQEAKPQTPPPPPEPTREEQLLTEIRDLLKEGVRKAQ